MVMRRDQRPTAPIGLGDSRTSQEIINGARGSEYGEEKTYSSDPEYGEVDCEAFSFVLGEDCSELLEK